MLRLGIKDFSDESYSKSYEEAAASSSFSEEQRSDRDFLQSVRTADMLSQASEFFLPGKKERDAARSDIFHRITVSLYPYQTLMYYLLGFAILAAVFWCASAFWIKVRSFFQYSVFSDYSFWYLFYYTFKAQPQIFIICLLIGVYLALLTGNKYAKACERLPDDEIIRPKRKDWTSNDWLNYSPAEIARVFEITKPKMPVNIPVCMYKGRLLNIPESLKHYQMPNQNMCGVGLSGTGKTYSFLEVYILTMIAMGRSFFSADTKGGILEKYEALLMKMGYQVEKMVLGDWAHSDGWDMFRPIVQAPASRADDYINNMAETLINTAGKLSERGPDFWTQQEQMLLRGLIYYVTRSPAYKGERTIKGLMMLLMGGTEGLRQVFAGLSPGDPAFTPTSNFRGSSETIQDSARSGLQGKLQIFETEAVMECLSYDTINIKEALKRPTATFLVTSDYLETYDVIAALFTSHVYQELTEVADSRKGKKLERPYNIAVDEICNMAAIRSFSKIISTNRSRNIHIAFAIQSVGQLEERYGKLWDNIMGNCAITLFFGCGNEDIRTAEVISKRCGKVKSVLEQVSMSNSPLRPKSLRAIEGSVRTTEQYVDLLPVTKAMTLLPDELLVCVAGRNVLKAEPYGAHLHPLHEEAEEAKEREDERKARLKEQGIEEWPEWLEHYLAENENAKPPVEKSFPASEFEKEGMPVAYSIDERRRFLAAAEAEKEEKQRAEERRREFEKYLKQQDFSQHDEETAGTRRGVKEFAKRITIEMPAPAETETVSEGACIQKEQDDYDPELEDFD